MLTAMKKKYIFLCCFIVWTGQVLSQQNYRVVTAQQEIQYLKKKPGGPATAIRHVTVRVEYWSTSATGNTDKNLDFGISSATAASSSAPSIQMVQAVISKDSFSTDHRVTSYSVPVTIKALAVFIPEFFSIAIKGANDSFSDVSAGGVVGVAIKAEDVEEPVNDTKRSSALSTQ